MGLAPEYAAMFEQLAETPGPAMTDLPPEQARELYKAMRPVNPELKVGDIEDVTCPGPGGDIPLRIYTPQGTGPWGVLVNFHGGGWVIGDLDTSDAACRDLCATANLVVVSVDYRLAPEHVYPAAVEDCYAATAWVAANAAKLQHNGKIAVGGESAGGNLAAVVSQRAREDANLELAFQLLLYPVVDASMSQGSYTENAEGYLLETNTMHWFWDYYCPDKSLRAEPDASPANAASLENLPPALVVTAEFDPLRDEGNAYAAALVAAGNEAENQCYPGLVHDFFATAQIFKASRVGFEHACQRLREHLS